MSSTKENLISTEVSMEPGATMSFVNHGAEVNEVEPSSRTHRSASQSDQPIPYMDRMDPDGASDPPSGVFNKDLSLDSVNQNGGEQNGADHSSKFDKNGSQEKRPSTSKDSPPVGYVNPVFQTGSCSDLNREKTRNSESKSTNSKSSQTYDNAGSNKKKLSKKNKGVKIADNAQTIAIQTAVQKSKSDLNLSTDQSDCDIITEVPKPRDQSEPLESEENSPPDGVEVIDSNSYYMADRGMWSGRWEFLFSSISYVVGLGNIWRFPYLCYRNGGGAFLLPYALFLCLVALPLVYLEMLFGQYAALGPVTIWNIAPVFKGLGIAMLVCMATIHVYYNVIIGWAFYMFFASMKSTVPWATCDNKWNTKYCCDVALQRINCSLIGVEDYSPNVSCVFCPSTAMFSSKSGHFSSSANVTDLDQGLYPDQSTSGPGSVWTAQMDAVQNATASPWISLEANNETVIFNTTNSFVSPAEEYFVNNVLDMGDSIGDTGSLSWSLALCLLLSWVVVFLMICKGVRITGKIQYVLVVLPYAILVVLLVNSALLEGSTSGVVFYLKPQWERLTDPQVWYDAATQAFFSLSLCTGGLATLASYNKFQHNIYKDAWVVAVLDTLTSILAGFPVFMTMGYIANQLDTSVEEVINSGIALAFVAYPAAIAKMPASTVWSILFFLMLVTLGLGTQCVSVHTILTGIIDEYPRKLYKHRTKVLLVICLVMYLLGLPFLSPAGVYMIELLDHYVTGIPVFLFGILEPVVICWVYGYRRWEEDILIMIGKKPWKWWQLMWQIVAPTLVLGMLVYAGVMFEPAGYLKVPLPGGAQAAGWVMVALCIVPIPAYAIYALSTTQGPIKEGLRRLVAPSDVWGLPPEADVDPKEEIPDYIYSEEEVSRRKSIASEHDLQHAMSQANVLQEGQCGDDIDTGSIQWSEDENKERGNWKGRYDFLMSGLGYTIGIGNVWRFPYLVYKNGGGAFFLPYVLMLVCCGIPIFYLELAMGQFASVGPISIWSISPLFKGVGYAAVVTLFLISIYYNVINAWSIYYLVASMTGKLPWGDCKSEWNTEAVCRVRGQIPGTNSSLYQFNASYPCNATNITSCNDTEAAIKYTTPGQEYFYREVLGVSSDIGDLGEPQWRLCLCLLFSTVVTFCALIKGVKSSGKVVYFTVTFPYIILLILLIRYVTLGSGHLEGLRFYITPKWERLGDATVWGDAATQLFYSIGISMGGLIALSSYNRFHYDCYRDAYMICLIDSFTSTFAGFVIFSILGVMASEAGTEVDKVVEAKFTLAYVVYPEAVTRLPAAPVWSVLFFIMLFLLAIDSQFLMVQSFIIAITDEWEEALEKHRKKLIAAVCSVIFILGLPMVCKGGIYWVVLLDTYVSYWSLLVIGFLTCVAISWVYTVPAFSTNIRAMLGREPGWWWRFCWKFISPLIILFILIFSWVMYKPPRIEEWDYTYPDWAHAVGILIAVFPLLFIPVLAVVEYSKQKGKWRRKLKHSLRPASNWGPALMKHQVLVNYLPSHRRASLYSSFSATSGFSEEPSVFTTESSGDGFLEMEWETNEPPREVATQSIMKKKLGTAPSGDSMCDKQIQTMRVFEIEDSDVIVVSRKDAPNVVTRDQCTQTGPSNQNRGHKVSIVIRRSSSKKDDFEGNFNSSSGNNNKKSDKNPANSQDLSVNQPHASVAAAMVNSHTKQMNMLAVPSVDVDLSDRVVSPIGEKERDKQTSPTDEKPRELILTNDVVEVHTLEDVEVTSL